MRVALVLHGWPPESQGGTGLYVGALARALADAGHRVAVVHPGPPQPGPTTLKPAPDPGPVERFVLSQAAPRRFEDTWRRPAADGLLAAWARRWRPDVVHVHHLSHASLGWPATLRAQGVPVVLTLHDYALPCARGQLVDAALQPCPGPLPERCAACLAPHLQLSGLTAPLGRALARWPALRGRARELAAARPPPTGALRLHDREAAVAHALAAVDVLLSPSHDLARRFAALGLRRPRVLDLPLVRPVPPAGPPGEGPLRILYASTVIPTKGPDRLVRAFAALPPGAASLTIAGGAPPFDGQPGWAARLQAEVQALPHARWLGPQPPEAMPALLAEHDLLVLPSTWPENSPLVLREATAAGLRVVVPAQGGAHELAPDAPRVEAHDDAGLLRVLRAEVDRGRGRLPPRRWSTPAEHAAVLAGDVYREAAGLPC